jgi:hypothetical protein
MTDVAVVNVFLTLRVLFLGGMLLALPHVTRRGLLFGVYVGEEFAGTETGRQLLRGWRLGCLSVMALALVVGFGISLWGRPVTGNLTGTGVWWITGAFLGLILGLATFALVATLS